MKRAGTVCCRWSLGETSAFAFVGRFVKSVVMAAYDEVA
jgi:hypothetical protein